MRRHSLRGESIPTPCLSYADAKAAISWLVDTFGAEARHVYDGPDDTVAHAELWLGGACVMLGSMKDNETPPNVAGQTCVYIVVEQPAQVDALYERVAARGARIVSPPKDLDYGSRDFGCLDPEGNYWAFGTYVPS